ncbi:hypothetical protein LPJ64_005525 [Coemansia asiatica]|uniref:Carbohydrate-binding module family 96 domain-containing protein n=1 Tax=Coemansia asiatica TaxID=1052880 RepID=A0A9W7XH03_9FUNG|nr:hypothetical protein LPJ64_005525 [Coemansia asiatica]
MNLETAQQIKNISASKDSSVTYNTDMCGDTACALISHGMEPTLVASSASDQASRILLGFQMPSGIKKANQIVKCELQMQRPVKDVDGKYTLFVLEASGSWSEDSVNGRTDVRPGNVIGSVDAEAGERPGPIDVTQACQDAAGQKELDLLVDSSGPEVVFPSMNTGAASMLRITTN